jgi:hypothetical protein
MPLLGERQKNLRRSVMWNKLTFFFNSLWSFIAFIKNERGSHPTVRSLDLWTNAQIGIERYYKERHSWAQGSIATPKFQEFINASIARLGNFHDTLLAHLKEKIKITKGGRFRKLSRLKKYLAFHRRMFCAYTHSYAPRQKFCVYTNPMFLDPELPLYHMGEELGYVIDDTARTLGEKEISEAEELFAKYFFFLGMMYSGFIFFDEKKNRQGVFLQMSFDSTIFRDICTQINFFFCNLEVGDNPKDVQEALAEEILNFYCAEGEETPPSYSETCQRFVLRYGNGAREIEPLSWYLFVLVREACHLCLRADIKTGKLSGVLKNFAAEWLALGREFYEKGQVNYSKLFNTQMRLIQFLTA